MPHKVTVKALSNRLYRDLSKLDEELNLPLIGKPAVGNGVNEDFNTLDLPNVSSKMLSRYLQYASGMQSFALVCYAKAENQAQSIHEALTRRIAELRLIHDDGQQKYKIDAAVGQDEQVVKLQDKALTADASVRLYKAYCAVFESRVNMLSREITRRNSEQLKGT
jgi:hypothetical protein